MKKAFTLVEMLVVIVIIGILMAALLPKLSSAQDKAKDKKSLTAVRDLLIAQEAWNNSYPIHGVSFSRKPYIIDKWKDWTDITTLLTKWFKKWVPWWAGSWVYIYNTSDAKIDWTEANKFLKEILSKISTKDMSQLTRNDNQVVALWFFWNLGKLLQENGVSTSDPLIKTLKSEGFIYIDKTNTDSKAKAVWGGFVLWLDRTPGNGGVQVSDPDLIADNEELKDHYVNFAFVDDELHFMSDLIKSEEDKKTLVTALLKAIKSQVWIWDLTAGN